MATIGLITRLDAQQALTTPVPRAKETLRPETLWALGEKGVVRMNPLAHTKHMRPSGSKRPDVYVLGEAPGDDEDKAGEPFVGSAGALLRRYIPEGAKVRYDNVVRTMPIYRGKPQTRKPLYNEIECYRSSVTADIEKAAPKVVMAVGGIAFSWCTGLVEAITYGRGRWYPAKFGKHVCWVYPVLHPGMVLRAKKAQEQGKMFQYGDQNSEVPGEEVTRIFQWDIRQVFKRLPELPDPVVVDDPAEIKANVTCLTRCDERDFKTLQRFLRRMEGEKAVGVDIEATALRPYKAGAKILSVSIGTRREVIAFSIDHPEGNWGSLRGHLLQLLRSFFTSGVRLVAHNLSYELEWFLWLLGTDILLGNWHDTMSQAYVLDERKGCKSLNSLTRQYFGFRIKEFSNVHVDESTPHRLEFTPLREVLEYNALDSKWTQPLYFAQKKRLKEDGLLATYDEHRLRITSLVFAQFKGMPVDQKQVKAFQIPQEAELKRLIGQIDENKTVKRYRSRFGTFSPTSGSDLIKMFRDFLGRKEGERKDGGYSTDAAVLGEMKTEPLAALIVAMRKVAKLKSTYIDPLDPALPGALVYPDGKLHPQIKHTDTDTGRLSMKEPNGQNYPKRKNVEIRKVIAPGPDEVILCADYGQIEYRGIGMLSLDKVVVESCWTGYDVHAYWAEEIIKAYPNTFKARYGKLDPKTAFKAFRSDVKNQFVFPFFFKAGWKSIGRNLEMPDHKIRPLYDRARAEFSGVTKWQGKVLADYEKNLYVEDLLGRRRHGPMNPNMVVNAGVQGTAAELILNAMRRLCSVALKTDRHYLAPFLQIHDDLPLIVPKKKVDEVVPILVRSMCQIPWAWAKVVPISVEVTVGPNWAEQSKVGDYRSDKLAEQL